MPRRTDRRRNGRGNNRQNANQYGTPSKAEYQVAKWMRANVKIKCTKMYADKVEYFTGNKAVDALMGSHFAKGKSSLFQSRKQAVQFLNTMLQHNFFFRAEKVSIQADYAAQDPQDDLPLGRSRKVGLIGTDLQIFVDGAVPYVWVYSTYPLVYWLYGSLILLTAVLISVMPLWPMQLQEVFFVTSYISLSLILVVLVIIALRFCLFVLIYAGSNGRIRFRIFPQFFSNVSLIEAFCPLYEIQYGRDDDPIRLALPYADESPREKNESEDNGRKEKTPDNLNDAEGPEETTEALDNNAEHEADESVLFENLTPSEYAKIDNVKEHDSEENLCYAMDMISSETSLMPTRRNPLPPRYLSELIEMRARTASKYILHLEDLDSSQLDTTGDSNASNQYSITDDMSDSEEMPKPASARNSAPDQENPVNHEPEDKKQADDSNSSQESLKTIQLLFVAETQETVGSSGPSTPEKQDAEDPLTNEAHVLKDLQESLQEVVESCPLDVQTESNPSYSYLMADSSSNSSLEQIKIEEQNCPEVDINKEAIILNESTDSGSSSVILLTSTDSNDASDSVEEAGSRQSIGEEKSGTDDVSQTKSDDNVVDIYNNNTENNDTDPNPDNSESGNAPDNDQCSTTVVNNFALRTEATPSVVQNMKNYYENFGSPWISVSEQLLQSTSAPGLLPTNKEMPVPSSSPQAYWPSNGTDTRPRPVQSARSFVDHQYPPPNHENITYRSRRGRQQNRWTNQASFQQPDAPHTRHYYLSSTQTPATGYQSYLNPYENNGYYNDPSGAPIGYSPYQQPTSAYIAPNVVANRPPPNPHRRQNPRNSGGNARAASSSSARNRNPKQSPKKF